MPLLYLTRPTKRRKLMTSLRLKIESMAAVFEYLESLRLVKESLAMPCISE